MCASRWSSARIMSESSQWITSPVAASCPACLAAPRPQPSATRTARAPGTRSGGSLPSSATITSTSSAGYVCRASAGTVRSSASWQS